MAVEFVDASTIRNPTLFYRNTVFLSHTVKVSDSSVSKETCCLLCALHYKLLTCKVTPTEGGESKTETASLTDFMKRCHLISSKIAGGSRPGAIDYFTV